MITRMMKNSWTPVHDEILANLAKTTWSNKKALLETIEANMTDIDPVKALYHAVTHNKVDYEYFPTHLTGDALTDAEDMLRAGSDSENTQKQISFTYGILLSKDYYSKLRFKVERGEYNVVQTASGKFVFEHRQKIAQNLRAIQPNVKTSKINAQMAGKWVTHPETRDVAENSYVDLFMCTPSEAYKIKMINFVGDTLGLDFGQLIGQIDAADLSTQTPQAILRDLFEDTGLSEMASNMFDTTENEA